MNSLRRTFGIAEPIRRGMELKIAREGEWRPAVLGGSAAVSSDILAGRDAEISWEDVYTGMLLSCFSGLGGVGGDGKCPSPSNSESCGMHVAHV